MLTQEQGGCVYGISILQGGKKYIEKRENCFCSFKLMGTKRMSGRFYQWGLDGYSPSKASCSDKSITAGLNTNHHFQAPVTYPQCAPLYFHSDV